MATGSWDDWIDLYEELYQAPRRVPEVVCPTCGRRDVRFVLVVQGRGDEVGHVALWSEFCRKGIFVPQVPVREDLPAALEGEVDIPNYHLVTG